MNRQRKHSQFTADMTSDGKRLTRGEHWLLARTLLRRRDKVHHRSWKVITLAGENPRDEVSCIRELMPKADIVAVDKSESAVEAACRAGANVSCICDLYAFREPEPKNDHISRLPLELATLAPFDVVNLDVCGDVSSVVPLIRRYSYAVAKKGVLMVTFSYGRDVVELFDAGAFGDVPAPLGGRVREVAKAASSQVGRIVSTLAYKGNQMPMCSCVWGPGRKHKEQTYGRARSQKDRLLPPESFCRIGDDDLYAAVVMYDRVDPEMLYAVPAERILHFRRKLAAEKAVATRRSRQVAKDDGNSQAEVT
jgi:hypothetical protein